MSNVSKLAVPLLLLAAVAGGIAYYATQSSHDAPPPTPATAPTPPPKAVEQPAGPAVATPQTNLQPERVASTGPTSTEAHSDAEQGVRGRVLLPGGAPAPGITVLLLESAMNDPVMMFLNNKTGRTNPPLASAQTGADGTFTLGLPRVGKAIDLRIVSDDYPEYHRQQIKIRDKDWYDTGDLQLEAGVVVTGRVVELNSKAPLPNATVWLASSHQSHAMAATPGRERGIPTTTDGNGMFRFANGPKAGLVNLVAEAQGYASGQVLNQQLKTDAPNDYTLELELGQPIAGVVVDPNGQPIANVTINANGLSSKTPQAASAVSDSDGGFVFPSLRSGPYQLTATSTQHAEVRVPLVLTGETEVKVVLSTRGTVHLKVLAATGQPLKAYRISLKRYFPNNPFGIANVMDFPDRQVSPSDYPRDLGGEFAAIKGLPAGDFRFQITDTTHAKSLSPNFTIVEGAGPVEVVATLTLGATITGTVMDDRGAPVADATVSTDMNGGLAADTGLFDLFRSMIPEKHSKASTKTNAQGQFKISKLAFAEYMVRVSHPNYCEGTRLNIKLENEGQVEDAGVIQLALGAVLEGTTTIGGQPAGQVKVTVSTPMSADSLPTVPKDGQMPSGQGRVLFNATVQSDGEGRFRLLKRVPPGTYKVTASRPSSGNDPFKVLLDMKETAKEITVAPGQETVTLNFDLPRQ